MNAKDMLQDMCYHSDCDNCPASGKHIDCFGITILNETPDEEQSKLIIELYSKYSKPIMSEFDVMSIF